LFNQENDVSLLTSLLLSVYLFGQVRDEHYKLPSLLFMFVVSFKFFFFSLLFNIAYFVDSSYFISQVYFILCAFFRLLYDSEF